MAFVADPTRAPCAGDLVYARPDDLADDGRTWRDLLLDYNRDPGGILSTCCRHRSFTQSPPTGG